MKDDMKKRTLFIFFLLVLACLVMFWWFSGDPSTELVDGSGRKLTAGTSTNNAEDPTASPFASIETMIEERKFEEAETALLEMIETTDHDGRACILLCDVTRELKKDEEAVDYGLKAIGLLPDSAEAHLAYAKALGMQMARSIKSLTGIFGAVKGINTFKEEINLVIELDPENIEARSMLMFTNLAPWPIGDIDEAIRICGDIERLDPKLGKRFLAFCLHRKEETERAIELCLTCIETYPEEPGFHLTLANIYTDEERFEEADAEYEAAREGEKGETYYQSLYYQALMRVNNEFEPERAVELLDEFIAADPHGEGMPSVAYACLRKGNALEQLEMYPETRAAYEECLRIEPDFEPVMEAMEELEKKMKTSQKES